MEHFSAGVATCVGGLVVTVVLAVLCAFWRKTAAASRASDPEDVTADEDGRKGFIVDDPYHYIDFSDDVKTLSSATSGDSAFDVSPNGSGQSLQPARGDEGGPSWSGQETSCGSCPQSQGSGGNGVLLEQEGVEAEEASVYEVIAFGADGTVNHNPSTSQLHQVTQVGDHNVPTYEDVGEEARVGEVANVGEGEVATSDRLEGEARPSCRQGDKDDVALVACEDEVFEEGLYSPVYESLYMDCFSSNQRRPSSSQDRKDSGVVQDMVPSPTENTPPLTSLHSPHSPPSSSATTAPTGTVPCDTPSPHSQNVSSKTPDSQKEAISDGAADCNPTETLKSSGKKSSSKKGLKAESGETKASGSSSEKDGSRKGSKGNGERKPLSHWGSIKARVSLFRRGRKKEGAGGEKSGGEDNSTHTNMTFEQDDPSPHNPPSSPSAETEGGVTETSPSPSSADDRVTQTSNDQAVTSVSAPLGSTSGKPFSYLTNLPMPDLPKLLPSSKDSTENPPPEEEGGGTATPQDVPLSPRADPSRPLSLKGSRWSLQSQEGLGSGQDTPRSSSRPRPPVPPKPVCSM